MVREQCYRARLSLQLRQIVPLSHTKVPDRPAREERSMRAQEGQVCSEKAKNLPGLSR